ncbi:MAG: M28 family metallopeptidase [Pseudomonadota bacterium]
MRPLTRLSISIALLLLLAACSSAPVAPPDCTGTGQVSVLAAGNPLANLSRRDLDQILAAPRANADREARAQALLAEACPDLSVEPIPGHKQHNLVCTLTGRSPQQILVGAHYDRAGQGSGVADNWTGVVTTLRLLTYFVANPPEHTLVFALFGEEEPGMIGSAHYARSINPANLRAMINIDTLGLGPVTIDRRSDPTLACQAHRVARLMAIAVRSNNLPETVGDWRVFRRAGVPVLNLHSLDRAGLRVVHTRRDRAETVNLAAVNDGYRVALQTLRALDRQGG